MPKENHPTSENINFVDGVGGISLDGLEDLRITTEMFPRHKEHLKMPV